MHRWLFQYSLSGCFRTIYIICNRKYNPICLAQKREMALFLKLKTEFLVSGLSKNSRHHQGLHLSVTLSSALQVLTLPDQARINLRRVRHLAQVQI